MKIAIVHEWFVNYAGSEKVVEKILECYPDADLFALVDFLPDDSRKFIMNKKVSTSFIQKLPMAKKSYRNYIALMPIAIEQFDLSSYDLIISSSHAVAKGVLTGPDQLHISYVHSPIRYAWDFQHQYLQESGLTKGLKSILARWILHKIRLWDTRTSNGVDYFLANSHFIARRIMKSYHRQATVVYPPVDVEAFKFQGGKEEFYLTASRMVPYKKIDLIVAAFSLMKNKQLIVIGDGPEFEKIKLKAGDNVQLLGYQEFDVLKKYMMDAKAFVFAAEEDFGITPVEAQACGTPVIAFGKGGALETVLPLSHETPTGVLFLEQTVESIIEAVNIFENNNKRISAENCRKNAVRFSNDRFKGEFVDFVKKSYEDFNESKFTVPKKLLT